MSARSSGLSALVVIFIVLPSSIVLSAPLAEQSTETDTYYPVTDATGCYYNFQHYDEGDRIITNEPCLNCTCHNKMLMCYLRVCPFIKAVGENCKVEKKTDQCCPVITCPEVPVQLLTSTTTRPSTEIGHLDKYGCTIDKLFYSDGARVPSDSNKPCELCYCIRNKTACVMQECTLNIEGCKPVYQEGTCCPVKYDCEHPDEDNLLETTPQTTPGLIFTTTMTPGASDNCVHNNEIYLDGAMVKKDKCEHCYCMKGDLVCAVQECGPTPLDKVNCTALPPREGQCCPDTYECEHMIEEELTTLSYQTSPEITTQFPEEHTLIGLTTEKHLDEETAKPEVLTTTIESDETATVKQRTKEHPEDYIATPEEIVTKPHEERKETETEIPLERVTQVPTVEPHEANEETTPESATDAEAIEKQHIPSEEHVKEVDTTTKLPAGDHITDEDVQKTTEHAEQSTEQTILQATEKPILQETEKPVLQETEKPALQETEKPILEISDKPTTEEIEKQTPAETEIPSTVETEHLIPEETGKPIPEKPISKETDKAIPEETGKTTTERTGYWTTLQYPFDDEKDVAITKQEVTTQKIIPFEKETESADLATEIATVIVTKPSEQITESYEVTQSHATEETETTKLFDEDRATETSKPEYHVTTTKSVNEQQTDSSLTTESEHAETIIPEITPTVTETPVPETTDEKEIYHEDHSIEPEEHKTLRSDVSEAAMPTTEKTQKTEEPLEMITHHEITESPEESTKEETTKLYETTEAEHPHSTSDIRESSHPLEKDVFVTSSESPISHETSKPEDHDLTTEPVPSLKETETQPEDMKTLKTETETTTQPQKSKDEEFAQSTTELTPTETERPEVTEQPISKQPATEKSEHEHVTEEHIPQINGTKTESPEQVITTFGTKEPDIYEETSTEPQHILEPDQTSTEAGVKGVTELSSEEPEATKTPEEITTESIPISTEPTKTYLPPKKEETEDITTNLPEAVSTEKQATEYPEEEDHKEQTSPSQEIEKAVTEEATTLEITLPENVTSELPEEFTKKPTKHMSTTLSEEEKEVTESSVDHTEKETEQSPEIYKPDTVTSVTLQEEYSKETTLTSATTEPTKEEHTEINLIPGEGSCLVDGQTYSNNSSVPPINHCQLSCKCISSILQCEYVTCTPAPSNLLNCMPVYQGPDSCCPTYSCTPPDTSEIESDSHKMDEENTQTTLLGEAQTQPSKIEYSTEKEGEVVTDKPSVESGEGVAQTTARTEEGTKTTTTKPGAEEEISTKKVDLSEAEQPLSTEKSSIPEEGTEKDLFTSKPVTPESETSKPGTETVKPEVETSKPELEISKPETETTEPEVKTSKPETETSQPEIVTSKPSFAETTIPAEEATKSTEDKSKPDTERTSEAETSSPETEITKPTDETIKPVDENLKSDGNTATEMSETTEIQSSQIPEETTKPLLDKETASVRPDISTTKTSETTSETSKPLEEVATSSTDSSQDTEQSVTTEAESQTSKPAEEITKSSQDVTKFTGEITESQEEVTVPGVTNVSSPESDTSHSTAQTTLPEISKPGDESFTEKVATTETQPIDKITKPDSEISQPTENDLTKADESSITKEPEVLETTTAQLDSEFLQHTEGPKPIDEVSHPEVEVSTMENEISTPSEEITKLEEATTLKEISPTLTPGEQTSKPDSQTQEVERATSAVNDYTTQSSKEASPETIPYEENEIVPTDKIPTEHATKGVDENKPRIPGEGLSTTETTEAETHIPKSPEIVTEEAISHTKDISETTPSFESDTKRITEQTPDIGPKHDESTESHEAPITISPEIQRTDKEPENVTVSAHCTDGDCVPEQPECLSEDCALSPCTGDQCGPQPPISSDCKGDDCTPIQCADGECSPEQPVKPVECDSDDCKPSACVDDNCGPQQPLIPKECETGDCAPTPCTDPECLSGQTPITQECTSGDCEEQPLPQQPQHPAECTDKECQYPTNEIPSPECTTPDCKISPVECTSEECKQLPNIPQVADCNDPECEEQEVVTEQLLKPVECTSDECVKPHITVTTPESELENEITRDEDGHTEEIPLPDHTETVPSHTSEISQAETEVTTSKVSDHEIDYSTKSTFTEIPIDQATTGSLPTEEESKGTTIAGKTEVTETERPSAETKHPEEIIPVQTEKIPSEEKEPTQEHVTDATEKLLTETTESSKSTDKVTEHEKEPEVITTEISIAETPKIESHVVPTTVKDVDSGSTPSSADKEDTQKPDYEHTEIPDLSEKLPEITTEATHEETEETSKLIPSSSEKSTTLLDETMPEQVTEKLIPTESSKETISGEEVTTLQIKEIVTDFTTPQSVKDVVPHITTEAVEELKTPSPEHVTSQVTEEVDEKATEKSVTLETHTEHTFDEGTTPELQPPTSAVEKETLPEEETESVTKAVITETELKVTTDGSIQESSNIPSESVTDEPSTPIKVDETTSSKPEIEGEVKIHEPVTDHIPTTSSSEEQEITTHAEDSNVTVPDREHEKTTEHEKPTEHIPEVQHPETSRPSVEITSTLSPEESEKEETTPKEDIVTVNVEPEETVKATETPETEKPEVEEHVTEISATSEKHTVKSVTKEEEATTQYSNRIGEGITSKDEELTTKISQVDITKPEEELESTEQTSKSDTHVTTLPSVDHKSASTQKTSEEALSPQNTTEPIKEEHEITTSKFVPEISDTTEAENVITTGSSEETISNVTTTELSEKSETETTKEGLYTSGPTITTESIRPQIAGELSTSAPYPIDELPKSETTTTSSTTTYASISPESAQSEIPEYPMHHEDDYEEEDQSAFGPGTCRYGGKVYVSAQQIPRDDPCDFCFCFRSDIICLQQSCPPPIPRCHEEPIRGFCCPRYECPVSMATSLNVTTTTTTTTTTLPPHFLSHAYKGRATRTGCQINGQAYNVGDVIKSASGPCLHCTCGGDGQMKCDPKVCSPEPMLRQMIAAAASKKR